MRTHTFVEQGVNRYTFDFTICRHDRGWAQIDTTLDAAWYGTWAHPESRRLVSYIEGEVTIETAETGEEFAERLRALAQSHAESGSWKWIDAMCQPDIEREFRALGLGDLLAGDEPGQACSPEAHTPRRKVGRETARPTASQRPGRATTSASRDKSDRAHPLDTPPA